MNLTEDFNIFDAIIHIIMITIIIIIIICSSSSIFCPSVIWKSW